MEIPSSSPTYTPLKEQPFAAIPESDLIKVDLFPDPRTIDSRQNPSQGSHHKPRDAQRIDHNASNDAFDAGNHTRNRGEPESTPETLSRRASRASSIASDATTIYSDDETNSVVDDMDDTLTQELDKSTQNYFDELVTESLLESLPLPPAKRAKIRNAHS